MSKLLQAEVGIFFGASMSDRTIESRYGLLLHEIKEAGLDLVILRGKKTFDRTTRTFSSYSTLSDTITRHPGDVQVGMVRDFSGTYDFTGVAPALNHQGVRNLADDKNKTRIAFAQYMPQGAVFDLTQTDEIAEYLSTWPYEMVVVKPVQGKESKGVSIVPVNDSVRLQKALQEAGVAAEKNDKRVIFEEFIDTRGGVAGMPDTVGHSSTVRIIALDGEPVVLAARINQDSESLVLSGDANEIYPFYDPAILGEKEREICRIVHAEAARRGDGYSYLAIDLLYRSPNEPLLGEINVRPAIIEPKHSEIYSRQLAKQSAAQIARLCRLPQKVAA